MAPQKSNLASKPWGADNACIPKRMHAAKEAMVKGDNHGEIRRKATANHLCRKCHENDMMTANPKQTVGGGLYMSSPEVVRDLTAQVAS